MMPYNLWDFASNYSYSEWLYNKIPVTKLVNDIN